MTLVWFVVYFSRFSIRFPADMLCITTIYTVFTTFRQGIDNQQA